MCDAIRILLADDHPLARMGLRIIIENAPDMTIAGEAANGDEAQLGCATLHPDLLLLDLRMPGPSPLDTVAFVRQHAPNTRILVLSAIVEETIGRELIRAGAAGYVLKDETPERLIHAIRSVMLGAQWFSRAILMALALPPQHEARAEGTFSPRERQLLRLLSEGNNNARIATTLHLSEQTVRGYLSQLYTKLDVRNRAEALAWIYQHEDTLTPLLSLRAG